MSAAQSAALLGAAVLAGLVVFQLLLAAGVPWGHAAWGGQHRVLPTRLRWGSGAAAVVLALAAVVLLARAGWFTNVPPDGWIKGFSWAFTAFLALNTLGNATSKSRWERMVMTPVTVLLAGCFLVGACT